MNESPDRLSLFVQTIYAQLLEQLVDASRDNPVGQRPGSFVKKVVGGKTYWYLQTTRSGKQVQEYLGPETDALIGLIKDVKNGMKIRRQLSKMAVGGGAYKTQNSHRKVLELLMDAGIFQMGAVLIGAHAFNIYGNMFGYKWDSNIVATHDIDVAGEPDISLVADRKASIDLPAKLQQWKEMTFLPIPPLPLSPKDSITSFRDRTSELKIELLTPMKGRERPGSISLPQFNASAQPLRFLDFLMEDSIQAAVIGGDGVLVNVPRPARFAWHKLIVAHRRIQPVKKRKDLAHAESLFWVLLEETPYDVAEAWRLLRSRGSSWVSSASKSFNRLSTGLQTRMRVEGVGPVGGG